MRSKKLTAILAVLLATPLLAAATCYVGGHSEATLNTESPEMGIWKYTVTVNWDSGSQFALSHLDLLLGFLGHDCDCEDFLFNFGEPAGCTVSWEEGDSCTACYAAYFECHGDPSIPGIAEPLIKFEPYESDDDLYCEPGPIGEGVFVFYSDWEPEPIETPNSMLAFKAAGESCVGILTGVLPVLGCEEVAADPSSWGVVKSQF